MGDLTVKVFYKNKNLENVTERNYDFKEYAQMIKLELMRIIMDIEDEFIIEQNGRPKDEWDKDVLLRFNKIRHKLLDQANSIERLPNCLYYRNMPCNTQTLSEFLANVINNKE